MTPGTVIAATLLTDRKPESVQALEVLPSLSGICRVYVNLQEEYGRQEEWGRPARQGRLRQPSRHSGHISSFHGSSFYGSSLSRNETVMENPPEASFLEALLEASLETSREASSVPLVIERWSRSGWEGAFPETDRDQRRLLGIVTARNMAIDYALYQGSEWLLFVDSDVAPEPDGLRHLLALGKPLCGGLVPGRGEHGGVHYVFPGQMADPDWDLPVTEAGGVIRCGFGTCGYMLIHATVFSQLRFRFNPLAKPGIPAIAEDPAYCQDAIRRGLTDAFYIARAATAAHHP